MAKVASNDVELFFEVTGRAGAPWIAFSNALGGTLEIWDRVVASLGANYCCLTYDTRGHGRSSSSSRAVSMIDLANDFAAVLDAAGAARATVVGLSLGGMTAQALAIARPERVRSLVLVATAPYLPPREAWLERAATVRAKGMAAVADAILARWFTGPFTKAAGGEVEKVRDRFLASDPEGYARCAEAIAAMDLRPELGTIAAPTLVVAGADDPVAPRPVAADLVQRITGAELVVLPDAAHLIPVEQPEMLARLIARRAADRPAKK